MNRQNRFFGFLIALFAVFALLPAGALGEGSNRIESEMDFLGGIWSVEERVPGDKNGKNVPVYSAPFDNAWRGAKGKAAVSTRESFSLLGTAQNKEWSWIEYDVDSKNRRVGWVRTDQIGRKSIYECSPLDRALLRITRETFVTDDPRGGERKIKTLRAGDEVIGLGTVDSVFGEEWVYVETEIDGQPAWGFLPVDTTERIPSYTVVNGAVIYREGITIIGGDLGEMGENGEYVRRKFSPGELKGEGLYVVDVEDSEDDSWDEEDNEDDAYDDEGEEIWVDRIIYPSTLRILGSEAVTYGKWKEIRLPDGLEACDDFALYLTSVEKLIIPASYDGPYFRNADCLVGAYEVEEGNTVYRSVDGVLYSSDGKTLIRYPAGRKDEHFDVPAGVEVIGYKAFGDGNMSIPLKTISLPMGLKKIEAYAFSGCGRLVSLTIPLTVTELDPKAFAHCVSLERLSMPEALWQAFDIGDAYPGDFTYYNGDNGETMPAPHEDD